MTWRLKNIFFFILCLVFKENALFAQQCYCEGFLDSVKHHLKHNVDFREYPYCVYADSINRIFIYKRIPAFLYDESFDNMQTCDHCLESIRGKVLERVCNLEALKYLICLNDSGMKRLMPIPKDKPYEGYISVRGLVLAIPDVNKSFYDLIVRRYYDLLVEKEKVSNDN